ncbi:MAG TPA: response regulator, partial [Longimicrobium sp.]|nr:response regulator [Longimicrobium sp.]
MTQAEARTAAAVRQRALVLNVDDYDPGRYATSRVLRQAGFEVVDAATGEEALRLVQAEAPDLVVLDVNLPKMNGFDVCRKIRDNSLTPVIMLTGRTDEEHVLQGFN